MPNNKQAPKDGFGEVNNKLPAAFHGDARQIWQIALRDLHSQLGRYEYDSWIKNLSLVELDKGTALIAAPSSYARRRLENDYSEVLGKALSSAVGQPLSVEFTVEAPIQTQLFEAQAAKPDYAMAARNVPGPGIKSKGPYLNLGQNDNNRSSRSGYNSSSYRGKGKTTAYNNDAMALETSSQNTWNQNDNSVEDDRDFDERQPNFDVPNTQHNLNPRYLFDSYIVGNSNRMAAAAGRSVAENPGSSYNPLFIYGQVGLGKTHLLQAIGHEALRLRPYLKVLYVSSEKFTNDLINGIREQRMEEFRARYRSIDLLMIDDIQFIAGKEQTQEEFFHTFNTLVEANKQVIISSDRPPKALLVLIDRLRSRFEGGLISDVSLPDYEMRLVILQAKAKASVKSNEPPIPNDVIEFIAQKMPTNIRELEGVFTRVIAFGHLNNLPITVDLAAQALNDSLINNRKKLTKERIVDSVAGFFNVEVKELQGRGRSADIVLPRQVAMYIIRHYTDHSLVEIGQVLGGRDHTTVMHGLDKMEQAIETNSQLRQQVNHIVQMLQQGETSK